MACYTEHCEREQRQPEIQLALEQFHGTQPGIAMDEPQRKRCGQDETKHSKGSIDPQHSGANWVAFNKPSTHEHVKIKLRDAGSTRFLGGCVDKEHIKPHPADAAP